jgi:hypothetical protein
VFHAVGPVVAGRFESNQSSNTQIRFADTGGETWAVGTDVDGAGANGKFQWWALSGSSGAKLTLLNNGNLGVGTTTPSTALEVVGSVTVSGNIAAKYQDIAEWVPSRENLRAGAVVVLDKAQSNSVIQSSRPYDTTVAGVVSPQPGLILGEQGAGKFKVATTGRVKVRVDATAGAIEIGDVLVTSAKAGTAMKSEAISLGGIELHRPGTILGKALEALPEGEGEILVLLSLQ